MGGKPCINVGLPLFEGKIEYEKLDKKMGFINSI